MLQKYILVFVFSGVAHSFLLGNDCLPDPKPCNITDNVLRCTNRQLQTVPKIQANISYIYFDHNNFTSIEDNAFSCLTNASLYIHVYLNDNRLRNIANGSFNGIGIKIITLDLSNNELEFLYSALGQLPNLNVLFLAGNRIAHFNTFAMVNIGRTLTALVISFGNITFWPVEFRYLRNLMSLTLIGVPLKRLPTDAFRGFEFRLEILNITNTQLEKIPSAICHVRRLFALTIYNNKYLEERLTPVIQSCEGNKIQVDYVTFTGNNIETYPNIYDMFRDNETSRITLSRNQLHIMNLDNLLNDTMTHSIHLDDNKFVRIPSAINIYTNLGYLNLSRNLIQSVEDCDILKLKRLTELYLDHNPLEFISIDAFKNNRLLNRLSLSNTKLIRIPSAVQQLRSLAYLELGGLQIECTCDMVYVHTWNVSSIYFSENSKCFSSTEGIKDYIINSLHVVCMSRSE